MSDRMRRHLNDISPVIYSDKCVTTNSKKSPSLIHETRVNPGEQKLRETKDGFVHEPEEQTALLDATIYLHALFKPQLQNKMATRTGEFEKNDGVGTTALRPLTAEDDTDSIIKPAQSLLDAIQVSHNKEEMNTKPKKYPHATDADVIGDICSYSNEPDNGFVLSKRFSPRTTRFGVTNNIHEHGFYYNDKSTEYWSDEDYRYPPQMSLSPPPGKSTFRKKTLKEKKSKEEPQKKIPEKTDEETKQLEDYSKILLKKRPLTRTLAPIGAKSEYHHHQKILNLTEKTSLNASPLFVNTAESVSPTRTSHPYDWKPRDAASDEFLISSPSLIQPTLSLTPTPRKEKHQANNSNSSWLTYSYRMKNDNIFDSQRCSMPKRRVSRSQSSTTVATAPTLFPEIPIISKTQGTSKSISDFRQSSSIFGKFVKKHSFKERLDDRREAKLDKESSQAKGSSRNRTGESTKTKIRRMLSLN